MGVFSNKKSTIIISAPGFINYSYRTFHFGLVCGMQCEDQLFANKDQVRYNEYYS